MPSLDSLKLLTAYRTSLKRTLLDSKTVKFRDAVTLDVIACYTSDWIYFPLLEKIIFARYNYLGANPSSTFEFVLEGWELCLLITTFDGVVTKKILATDIRKYYYDERDHKNVDYSEYDYDD